MALQKLNHTYREPLQMSSINVDGRLTGSSLSIVSTSNLTKSLVIKSPFTQILAGAVVGAENAIEVQDNLGNPLTQVGAYGNIVVDALAVIPLTINTYRDTVQGASINLTHSRSSVYGTARRLESGDYLGTLFFRGSDGVGDDAFTLPTAAYIGAQAESAFTPITQQTYLSFGTTPLGSTTVQERMRINGAGQVGIGVTNPLANLHIGSSTTVSDFRMSNNSSSTVLNIYTASSDVVISNVTSGGTLQFQTNNIARMSINSAGSTSFTGGALGGTAGNEIILHSIYGTNTNGDYVKTKLRRITTGSDWTTAQATIQRTIDVTDMGYLGFGGSNAFDVRIGSGTTDIAVFEPNIIRFKAALGEAVTVSATAAATTVTYDVITNKNILYYTSAATANWTFNVRGSASATLNQIMDIGQSLNVVFMNTNTGTAYYPTAFQIDGSAVTPKWSGGVAPTAGNANSIDTYLYNIIKTGTSTYTVLAEQTKFA